MKKKSQKIYVIRKIVKANSFEEAIRREKHAEIVEVVLTLDKDGKFEAGIGFGWNDPKNE